MKRKGKRMSKAKFLKLITKRYPKWVDIRSKLRRKEISLEEALDLILTRKTVKGFEDLEKRERRKKEKKFFNLGGFRILLIEESGIGCHPSPEDFRPELYVNHKNKTGALIVYQGIYQSRKHFNELKYSILDKKEIGNSFYILINYFLYRKALNYGRHRNFTFLVGYDDGSTFVDRVSPQLRNVEEALEWLKPAEVTKAEKEGRKVYRQGDVFFVELKTKRKKISDYKYNLPFHHNLLDDNVTVVHHEHSTLTLPHPHFKPVLRKALIRRGD